MPACFHPEDTPLNLLNTTFDYNPVGKEKPIIAKKLEDFFGFKQSTLERSLEFGKAKTEKS